MISAIVVRNRLNAQKSTGPRTAEGKRASAANAKTHGVSREPAEPDSDVVAWLAAVIAEDAEVPVDLARALTHLKMIRQAKIACLSELDGAAEGLKALDAAKLLAKHAMLTRYETRAKARVGPALSAFGQTKPKVTY